ncbi:MAG: CHAD domain-containing protein [Cyanobium sp.]
MAGAGKDPADPRILSNGAFALALIQRASRRLVDLQNEVVADRDPEPLHQMRVAMRRLRTALRQFGPALELPEAVKDQRIARVARRLGLARDLDVLRAHLEGSVLPMLPEAERQRLQPVLRQLGRERHQSRSQVEKTLRSGSYLNLLAQLQRWQKKPQFTALGDRPLRQWLIEWQAPELVSIFQHPGWSVLEPEGRVQDVHDLRKQCKHARYALENLLPLTGPHCHAWAGRFRGLQELLGELHDLEVLRQAIDDQLPAGSLADLPALAERLERDSQCCWQRWRLEAMELQRPQRRRQLWRDLLRESGPGGVRPWWALGLPARSGGRHGVVGA